MGLVLGDRLGLGLVYQHGLGMACQPGLGLELVRALDVVLERGQHMVVGLALVCQLALDDLLEQVQVCPQARGTGGLLALVCQQVPGMVCRLGTELVPVVELEHELALVPARGLEQVLVCQRGQVCQLGPGLVCQLGLEMVCLLALVYLLALDGQLGPAQVQAEGMEQVCF